MDMTSKPPVRFYHHGKFTVAGGYLPDAITAYQTYGDPTNPCIIVPTCYGARLDLYTEQHLIGEGKVLDTRKYFIVTFASFSNGESSSPSNTPAPFDGPRFPYCSYEDNVRAQYAVIRSLGVNKIYGVVGFSMGGQQAYHWAVMYPDVVDRIVVLCSAARTSLHNKCMIEGPKYALLNSKDFEDGEYKSQPQYGIKAFGRAIFGWIYDPSFYRTHMYTMNGTYDTVESFFADQAETYFLHYWDANDLLSLLATWQRGDVSQVFDDGDLGKALEGIRAKVLLMPSRTDPFFKAEDSEIELSWLAHGQLAIIDSLWGHNAGWSLCPADVEFVTRHIAEFLK